METFVDDLQLAASEAVEVLGGPTKAAKRLTEISGRSCSRDRVRRWLINGIAPKWAGYVELATGIPKQRLRPDYFDESAT